MEKVFSVISHTHWDREWYLPFEQFRIKLVDLLDNTLKILKNNDDYIFHLDAQTIVLDDYLEINPGKQEEINKYIKEGRLLVGPWYVQNDFYLTSGESTIRNLLIGSRSAASYGRNSFLGYAPDQFGIISQLPQILRGFKIDNFIFGRGLEKKNMKSEFLWYGADKSSVLAVNLCHWYNNAQRFSRDYKKNEALLKKIENETDKTAQTPYRLCMNGVDHLEPQDDLPELIEKMNRRPEINGLIKQYTMENYLSDVKKYVLDTGLQLDSWTGELREGSEQHILNGTLSTRTYLKRENCRSQNMLEKVFEPFFSMFYMMGGENSYPSNYLVYLWKLLLKNHPHDSICGCSTDAVHNQMEERYIRFFETLDFLLERGLDSFVSHIDRTLFLDEVSLLVIVNTMERPRKEVMEVVIQFPANENIQAFFILNNKGKSIPFVITGKEQLFKNIISPVNLPGNLLVDSYRCLIQVEAPSFGYSNYSVNPAKVFSDNAVSEKIEMNGSEEFFILSNEYIKMTIYNSGQVDLENISSGFIIKDCLIFEEMADCGDVYTFRSCGSVNVLNAPTEIVVHSNHELRKEISIVYDWSLPLFFDRNIESRSEKKIINKLKINLILEKDNPILKIGITLDNKSMDHLIRVCIKSGIETQKTWSSSPFDIIERDFMNNQGHNGDRPTSGWVAVSDKINSLGILTKGIYGYEQTDKNNGIISLPLVRGNKYIFKDFDKENTYNPLWEAEENQCLRIIEQEIGILFPDNEESVQDLQWKLKSFQQDMLYRFQPVVDKKFKGGRPAVQDPAIQEIFYEKDPYPHLRLTGEDSLLSVSGFGVSVSAFKRSEDGKMFVLRLYNPGSKIRSAGLSLGKWVDKLFVLNLLEEINDEVHHIEDYIKGLKIKPKKILTLGISIK